nr:hypothetical protein CFP56_07474 [Quercus suber]
MHQKLLVSEVCTSPSMHTTFSLEHDESTLQVNSDIVSVKIDIEGDRIRIVVPKDENDRRRCFRAYLPQQLLKFLGISTPSAEKPMYRILNEPLPTLDDVLTDEGIVADAQLERCDQNVEHALVERMETLRLHQASAPRVIVNVHDNLDGSSYTDHHPAEVADIVDHYSPERFRKVLEHVVRQARAGGDALQNRGNGVTDYEPLSRGDIGSTLMSDGSWQRIGVAGELFVSLHDLVTMTIPILSWLTQQCRCSNAYKLLE